jgi:hypothetical protein
MEPRTEETKQELQPRREETRPKRFRLIRLEERIAPRGSTNTGGMHCTGPSHCSCVG